MVKEGAFDRPFTIAISAPLEDSLAQSGRVIYGGAYFRVTKDTVDMPVDTTSIRSGLMTIDPMSFRGPMVAANDRGPVRVSGSRVMMRNLIGAALRLDMAYREMGRDGEARAIERWAKGFVAVANCDPETRDIAATLEKMSKSVVTQARKAAKQR